MGLLVPTPNASPAAADRDRHGHLRMLSPGARTVRLELLAFLGQLLGVALRYGVQLPLALPDLFWDRLVAPRDPDGWDLPAGDASVRSAGRSVDAALEASLRAAAAARSAEELSEVAPPGLCAKVGPAARGPRGRCGERCGGAAAAASAPEASGAGSHGGAGASACRSPRSVPLVRGGVLRPVTMRNRRRFAALARRANSRRRGCRPTRCSRGCGRSCRRRCCSSSTRGGAGPRVRRRRRRRGRVQACASYEDGLTKNSPQVKRLWAVLRASPRSSACSFGVCLGAVEATSDAAPGRPLSSRRSRTTARCSGRTTTFRRARRASSPSRFRRTRAWRLRGRRSATRSATAARWTPTSGCTTGSCGRREFPERRPGLPRGVRAAHRGGGRAVKRQRSQRGDQRGRRGGPVSGKGRQRKGGSWGLEVSWLVEGLGLGRLGGRNRRTGAWVPGIIKSGDVPLASFRRNRHQVRPQDPLFFG